VDLPQKKYSPKLELVRKFTKQSKKESLVMERKVELKVATRDTLPTFKERIRRRDLAMLAIKRVARDKSLKELVSECKYNMHRHI